MSGCEPSKINKVPRAPQTPKKEEGCCRKPYAAHLDKAGSLRPICLQPSFLVLWQDQVPGRAW